MPKLLDIILALDAEDRRALSAIWIERSPDGGWQARCSICRDKFSNSSVSPGVGLMAWERVPNQEYPLDLDELDRDRAMRAQAAALQESGLIGTLDLARYDREDRSTAYLIKTHAGSQRERTHWLLSLKERPENTLYADEA